MAKGTRKTCYVVQILTTGTHTMQPVLDSSGTLPAGHKVGFADPRGHFAPNGQDLHVLVVLSRYSPPGHTMQPVLDSSGTLPASGHKVGFADPRGHFAPNGQGLHILVVLSKYSPPGHTMQSVFDASGTLPVGQWVALPTRAGISLL